MLLGMAATFRPSRLAIGFLSVTLMFAGHHVSAGGWPMHMIDSSSRGADGVRLADANGDGLLDIATGWEEGGVVRVYLHPGPEHVWGRWPLVTVGAVASPEDAVLVDVDGDGAMDVVSSCEGDTRAIFVHWAPNEAEHYRDDSAWTTEGVPVAPKVQWMFAAPADIDGRHGMDLFVGAKNEGAALGWLQAPENGRDLSAWTWHPLVAVGWTMSIVPCDMDADGDVDVLVSDRRGATRGVFWLEHPGKSDVEGPWMRHDLFGSDSEVMFLDCVEYGSGRHIACATADKGILLTHLGTSNATRLPWPARGGTGKSAALGDLDGDGALDLVVSAEHAEDAYGVQWTPLTGAPDALSWTPIGGLMGVKYDAVRLVDLDGDGDLDVITCEERDNLGVVWFENTRS